jgi:hypothetical protein
MSKKPTLEEIKEEMDPFVRGLVDICDTVMVLEEKNEKKNKSKKPPAHFQHLGNVINQAIKEEQYLPYQVLSFLAQTLTATCERDEMTQEDFDETCDLMKEEFARLRKARPDSSIPE